jgi:predicted ribosomally synthesized peptide with nif11-like leader
MSQEDLQKFLEAVRQDSSLQEKLRAEGANPVAIAKEAGLSLTEAELIRAHASHVQTLSDEELENAAGGTATIVICGGAVAAAWLEGAAGAAAWGAAGGAAGYGVKKGVDAISGDS